MMTQELAEILAKAALRNVKCRMQFSECYEEGLRNVVQSILDVHEATVLECNLPKQAGESTYYGD